MKILQIETARSAESKAATDRDKGAMPMVVDGESQSNPQFDTTGAFAVLVRNATEEFGFAPCDVYDGVFNFPEVKIQHAIKLKTLECSELMDLSIAFFRDHSLDDASQYVVAVQPHEGTRSRDDWTVNFKSPRIAREVVGLMLSIEYRHLLDTYHRLRDIGSGMAGTLFEVIAHRVLCNNDAPQPIAMASDNKIPPTFSTPDTPQSIAMVSNSGTPSTPPPHNRIITIDLLGDLRDVTSDSNRYYIPTSITNPLFHSFTVTFGPSKCAAVVSLFQITTSPEHGGSADGYPLIRKIIARARELLGCGQNADIGVKYILVCPEDGSHHRWQMPKGWNKDNTHNNQVGEGFCMRIPSHYLTVRPTAD